MAARRRLPSGFKRTRVRRAGTEAGWNAGLTAALAALYGQLPPMPPDECAQHQREAAAIPYRGRRQQDLPLVLSETDPT